MKSMNSNLTLGFLWQAGKEATSNYLWYECVCESSKQSLQVVFAGWLGTAEHHQCYLFLVNNEFHHQIKTRK